MPAQATPHGVGAPETLAFSQAPRRVVSLVPSITESLFEFGLGHCLVGVTDFCVHPAAGVAGLPKVGGTKNPNLSRIRAALPDLIIANQEENRKEDVEALRADGLKVWVTFPRTVREAIDVLWAMIRLFRMPHLGQTLSVLETSYEWTSLASEGMPRVKFFCPIWREPTLGPRSGQAAQAGAVEWWMTINRETYVHDILRVCGGENVFADRKRSYPLAADLARMPTPEAAAPSPGAERDTRYPRITPAEVAERAPELILLPSEPYPFAGADRADFEAFPEIPAVKNRRIVLVDGSLLTWHGTRLARALAELPSLLHPAAE